jgi:hypothetical protein
MKLDVSAEEKTANRANGLLRRFEVHSAVAAQKRVMLLGLFGLILMFFANSGFAAQHYIRADASGSNNGNDWANAWTSLPGTLVRGDTYYLASGNYGTWQISTPVSGTSFIYIRKATPGDHGTSSGWSDSYALGQAVLNGWPTIDLRTSYIDIDGVTGSGGVGYGIKLNNSAIGTQVGAIHVYNGFTANYISLRHLEVSGTGTDTLSGHLTYGIFVRQNGGTDWNIQSCYIHDVYTWMSTYQIANVVIDHCYLKNAGSNCASYHGDGLVFEGPNWTLRYSVIENMIGNSNTTYIEGQQHPNGVYIYGNLYVATDSSEDVTQWGVYCTPDTRWWSQNVSVYNNTVQGLHGPPGVSAANVSGPVNVQVYNNVWRACVEAPTFQRVDSVSNNTLNDGQVVAGRGAWPLLHLSGDNFDFGTIAPGQSADLRFTVANRGGGTLTGQISAAGPFSVISGGSLNVSDGNNQSVTVRYSPTVAGTDVQLLTFSSDGSAGNGSVMLVGRASGSGGGTAPPPVPNLKLTSQSSNFGSVAVGQTADMTITVANTGSGTLTGSASVSSPFTIISGGSYNLSSQASQTVTVRYAPTVAGSDSQTIFFSGAAGGSLTLTGTAFNPSTGDPLSFEAEAGSIQAPFAVSGGAIVQSTSTDLTTGGRATYNFNIGTAGDYLIKAVVSAPSDSENSLFVNIDAEPLDPSMIWDVLPLTSGFETRFVGWRGSGTFDHPDSQPKVFSLSAGAHQLIFVGREPNLQIDRFAIVRIPAPPKNLRVVSAP